MTSPQVNISWLCLTEQEVWCKATQINCCKQLTVEILKMLVTMELLLAAAQSCDLKCCWGEEESKE